MKFLSRGGAPGQHLHDMVRQKKWKKALGELEKAAQVEERNHAIWNAVGDARFRSNSVQEAVEAWRRAVDGYAREGLYENAAGLVKKILRISADQTDLHLTLAELYLAMGYDADALSSLKTYLRLCSRPSEAALANFFRKVLESNLRHTHLLEELIPLFRESKIENLELQTELEKFVESRKSESPPAATSPEIPLEKEHREEQDMKYFGGTPEGLIALDLAGERTPHDEESSVAFAAEMSRTPEPKREPSIQLSRPGTEGENLPEGEGRDHYDLGVVYQEMKLWDAAIAEFEQASRDENLHFRAALALVGCVMSKGDPRQALDLLEKFESGENLPLEDELHLELLKGEVQQAVGNLSEALGHYEKVHERQSTFGNVEEKIGELKAQMAKKSAP
jgi:tetratricopeptide (TPR) repeat protein